MEASTSLLQVLFVPTSMSPLAFGLAPSSTESMSDWQHKVLLTALSDWQRKVLLTTLSDWQHKVLVTTFTTISTVTVLSCTKMTKGHTK